MHTDYYVYEWYIEDTNHVFYVGKGRLYRINEIRNRNKYCLAIYNKYKCKARKIQTGLTNKEACQLEKETIKKRKLSGEAECNFTYGGEGFSEGDLNPMYGKGFKGSDNPMYGKKGFSHPNSKMYLLEGETEPLTYKECGKRFGIAFSRIYEQGDYLAYKKSCTNKTLYEGKLLTRLK